MKILFVAPIFPWPLEAGGQVRLYHLLQGLSRDHDVTFMGPVQNVEFQTHLEAFCRLRVYPVGGASPISRLKDPAFWRRSAQRLRLIFQGMPPASAAHYRPELLLLLQAAAIEGFDIINFMYIDTAIYIDRLPKTETKLVLDTVHIATVTAGRQVLAAGNPLAKLTAVIHKRTMERFERARLANFDAVSTCSEIDAREVGAMSPGTTVVSVPNAVNGDLLKVARRPASEPVLLFVGGTRHEPNVDGLRFFLEGCWSDLRKRFETIRLQVVGQGWSDIPWLDDFKGVARLGFVPDLKTVFEKATLMIAPVRFGSGTRLKILEALAAGVPVVGTTISAEGIAVVSGKDALIADHPRDLTAAVTHLIENPQLAADMAASGQALIADRYLWENSVALLNDMYARLVGAEKGRQYA